MLKTILTPDNTDVHLSIPEEYVGKKVELIMYAIDEVTETQPEKKSMAKYRGMLSKKTTEALQKHAEKSRKEWERNF